MGARPAHVLWLVFGRVAVQVMLGLMLGVAGAYALGQILQGMLVQTTNALALRFQNVARNGRDPIAEFELDPLRPLSGFIWGYVRDEQARLSVARRAYEYHHEYGLSHRPRPMVGEAAPGFLPRHSPA